MAMEWRKQGDGAAPSFVCYRKRIGSFLIKMMIIKWNVIYYGEEKVF